MSLRISLQQDQHNDQFGKHSSIPNKGSECNNCLRSDKYLLLDYKRVKSFLCLSMLCVGNIGFTFIWRKSEGLSLSKYCVVVDFEADISCWCLSPAGKLPGYSRSRWKSIAAKRDKIYFMCFVSFCVEDLLQITRQDRIGRRLWSCHFHKTDISAPMEEDSGWRTADIH